MISIGRLSIILVLIALGLGVCTPVAQATGLGGKDYNDGTGNSPGLTYAQGSVTIGVAGDNKAWSFAPINWIDTTDANSGSVFLRSLVRREKADAQWGGVSFFRNDQSDEIMYFGAATSGGANHGRSSDSTIRSPGSKRPRPCHSTSVRHISWLVSWTSQLARAVVDRSGLWSNSSRS